MTTHPTAPIAPFDEAAARACGEDCARAGPCLNAALAEIARLRCLAGINSDGLVGRPRRRTYQ